MSKEKLMSDMEARLKRGRDVLDFLNMRSERRMLNQDNKWVGMKWKLELDEFYLFHVREVTFEEKAPRKEAMENILGTFRGMDGISFVYMILGDSQGVNFYFGVTWDKSYPENKLPFSIHDLEQDILTPSMKGNFRGSKIEEVSPDDKKKILERLQKARSVGMLEGVPGVDEEKEDFQGTDRLIDVMMGDEFGFVVIATPFTDAESDAVERQLYELSDTIAPLAHYTEQRQQSWAKNHNESSSVTDVTGAGNSSQHTDTESYSSNDTTNNDERRDDSNQIQSSANNSANEQWSVNKSFNKTKGHSDSSGGSSSRNETREDESGGNSSSEGYTVQNQSNYSYMMSAAKSQTTSSSHNESHGHNNSVTTSESKNISRNESKTDGFTEGDNISVNEQIESESKSAADWIEYIDKVLFPRIDHGRGKGVFLCSSYLFAKKRTTLYRLANTAISLYSGPRGNKAALFFTDLTEAAESDQGCLHALQNLQIPAAVRDQSLAAFPALGLSKWEKNDLSYCGSWLSANELGLLAGLPQKEVIGLKLREEVEFGLNVEPVPDEDKIVLGYLVQSGDEKKQMPVCLNKWDLDKHTFVSGVTGSGKTTTCQNILLDCGLPFLVIEPAKTEYRSLLKKCPDLLFFTPGLPDVAPFFLNPFELFPGEKITSRADMLKATFEASFTMEAAIPQILEAAIYKAYENKGWHIGTNLWKGKKAEDLKEGPFAEGVYAFPKLSDMLEAVKEITEKQGFDERLKNDYLGSINARLEGLLVGAKGQMFNTARSIDFSTLVHRKVVIELEEIRNSAEKSLLMGFIMTNLLQAVRHSHMEDKNFRHITLVEEAHRLLSRYLPGDSLNKKQGVEVFSDMLAEVRKYGESLIIVDQIPDKMTPEVLKNTNTKIVHKLFAQDDKDAIGNTMALNDDQKAFLSNLQPGRAIMFSQGWTKAIQVQVEEKNATNQAEVDPQEIRRAALNYYKKPENVKRGILRGIGKLSDAGEEQLVDYLELMQGGDLWLKIYHQYLKDGSAGESRKPQDREQFLKFTDAMRQAITRYGEEMVFVYMYWNTYGAKDEERESLLRSVVHEIAVNEDAKMSCITNHITVLSA